MIATIAYYYILYLELIVAQKAETVLKTKRIISVILIPATLIMIPCEVTASADTVTDTEFVLLPEKATQTLTLTVISNGEVKISIE